jgi:hypothetical protein
MTRISESFPQAIRIWVVRGVIHASIPRTVVRAPVLVDSRRESVVRTPSKRERYDLALNILNCLLPPSSGAQVEREPVKCFRGHCSAFAARYHCDFARDFLQDLYERLAIETGEIRDWIERRQELAREDLNDTESYLEAIPA